MDNIFYVFVLIIVVDDYQLLEDLDSFENVDEVEYILMVSMSKLLKRKFLILIRGMQQMIQFIFSIVLDVLLRNCSNSFLQNYVGLIVGLVQNVVSRRVLFFQEQQQVLVLVIMIEIVLVQGVFMNEGINLFVRNLLVSCFVIMQWFYYILLCFVI